MCAELMKTWRKTRLLQAIRRRAVLVGLLAAAVPGLACAPAAAQAPIEVDQVTDPTASEPTRLFRFRPALLRVPVGTNVRFLNMRGQHTVVSLPKMWPDGVPLIRLSNLSSTDVRFDKAGVYGFTCKVHGCYGMVMLVAVGDVFPNLEAAKAGMPGGLAGERMRTLMAKLEGKD